MELVSLGDAVSLWVLCLLVVFARDFVGFLCGCL